MEYGYKSKAEYMNGEVPTAVSSIVRGFSNKKYRLLLNCNKAKY
jgi:hypothetical protein